ncbi:MAG TPA: Ig domain-containing protein, partial [Terriglobales bacterium]|nr:Ig domain-containing protein [Terriglobales bacterium]
MSPKSTNLVSPVSRSVRRKTNRYPVTTLSVVLLAIIGLAPAFAQRRITLSADFAETLAANPQSVQLLAQTHLTISGNLPSAVVQTTYTGSLSVSGAPAPYRFSIDQGSLPPGLLLGSSDGVISGTPTTAGTYNFHVSVWANNNTAHGDNWMAIHVNPAAVSITISPTTSTVTSGGSQQFAAFVRGTNQTAVSWSASAGQISSQGLFTAP